MGITLSGQLDVFLLSCAFGARRLLRCLPAAAPVRLFGQTAAFFSGRFLLFLLRRIYLFICPCGQFRRGALFSPRGGGDRLAALPSDARGADLPFFLLFGVRSEKARRLGQPGSFFAGRPAFFPVWPLFAGALPKSGRKIEKKAQEIQKGLERAGESVV